MAPLAAAVAAAAADGRRLTARALREAAEHGLGLNEKQRIGVAVVVSVGLVVVGSVVYCCLSLWREQIVEETSHHSERLKREYSLQRNASSSTQGTSTKDT